MRENSRGPGYKYELLDELEAKAAGRAGDGERRHCLRLVQLAIGLLLVEIFKVR